MADEVKLLNQMKDTKSQRNENIIPIKRKVYYYDLNDQNDETVPTYQNQYLSQSWAQFTQVQKQYVK